MSTIICDRCKCKYNTGATCRKEMNVFYGGRCAEWHDKKGVPYPMKEMVNNQTPAEYYEGAK